MRLMQKLLVVLFALLLLLAGCKNEEIPSASEPEPENIRLWILTEKSDGMNAQAETIIETFKSTHPNLSIELEILPTKPEERAVRLERLRTEIMSGNGPDGYLLPTDYRAMDSLFPDVTQNMYNGVFTDITDYLQHEDDDFLVGINQTVLDAGVINGKQYVLPLRYDVPMIYADTEALQKFDVELTNTSLSILNLMKTACKTESDVFAACCNPSTHNVMSQLEPTYNYSSGMVEIDKQIIVDYFEAYNTLISLSKDATINSSGFITLYIHTGECLGTETPLAISTLSRLMDYIAVSKAQQRQLSVYPMYSVGGEYVANVTYYAAVGSNTAHPELVYSFLREFLVEENQWEQDRKTTSFPGLVEEGWPIRDKNAAENLWEIYRLQHRNVYDDEKPLFARKQAILSLELTSDDFAIVSTQISQARFPSRNEDAFIRDSLFKITDTQFDGNYSAVAEDLLTKLQRAFAEG